MWYQIKLSSQKCDPINWILSWVVVSILLEDLVAYSQLGVRGNCFLASLFSQTVKKVAGKVFETNSMTQKLPM